MTRIQKALAALAIGAAATTAGATAFAQAAPAAAGAPAAGTPAATTASAPVMSIRQIYDTLEAAGYRSIVEIERSRKHGYEVKANDPQGQRVKLYVDAQTGAVTRSRIDD